MLSLTLAPSLSFTSSSKTRVVWASTSGAVKEALLVVEFLMVTLGEPEVCCQSQLLMLPSLSLATPVKFTVAPWFTVWSSPALTLGAELLRSVSSSPLEQADNAIAKIPSKSSGLHGGGKRLIFHYFILGC